jgi:hypothetical protein
LFYQIGIRKWTTQFYEVARHLSNN